MTDIRYIDLRMQVVDVVQYKAGLVLLTLQSRVELPLIRPGQFVNILPPKSAGVMLRRPISICDVEYAGNRIKILVKNLGRGSGAICNSVNGDELNVLLPLGHGFTLDLPRNAQPLLIGGGVGVAPLMYLGKTLLKKGFTPEFLLGGRTTSDIPMQKEFAAVGKTYFTTEDGTVGEKGFVTDHTRFSKRSDFIYCCGPMPMMKAVANATRSVGTPCEVSLENKMACGIGACLCCVEDTKEGNKCTCTHGPVFNVEQLKW